MFIDCGQNDDQINNNRKAGAKAFCISLRKQYVLKDYLGHMLESIHEPWFQDYYNNNHSNLCK